MYLITFGLCLPYEKEKSHRKWTIGPLGVLKCQLNVKDWRPTFNKLLNIKSVTMADTNKNNNDEHANSSFWIP